AIQIFSILIHGITFYRMYLTNTVEDNTSTTHSNPSVLSGVAISVNPPVDPIIDISVNSPVDPIVHIHADPVVESIC
ncbi:unnamed protein product, partial [Rotaria sp. Silwood2]